MSYQLFKVELEELINKYSMENGSNTPDFMLAEYLFDCLQNFEKINNAREKWYGIRLRPGGNYSREEKQ